MKKNFLKHFFYNSSIVTFLLVFISFAIFASIAFSNYIIFDKKKTIFEEDLKVEQNLLIHVLKTSLASAVKEKSLHKIQNICDSLFLNEDIVGVNVCDGDGKVIYHKFEVSKALDTIFTKSEPIFIDNKFIGKIEIKTSSYPIKERLKSYLKESFFIYFLQFILTLLIIFILVQYKIYKPISDIKNLLKAIKKKDFSKKNSWKYDDELHQIGKDLETIKEELACLNQLDPLTKIYNRMFLVDNLSLHVKNKTPFSVIFINIDNFKYINDTFGYKEGDDILIKVIDYIASIVPKNAIFGRWIFEKFLIIIPNSHANETFEIASFIQKKVATKNISPLAEITCSFGVSEYKDGEKISELLNRADKALFMAKVEGKNKVISL